MTMRLLAAIVTAGAALCAPALAGAATVAHDPLATTTGATYTADAGEANQLSVGGDATSILFGDVVNITTAAPPASDCVAPGGPTASCPSLAPATIGLGDSDDEVTLGSGAPSASIQGGTGDDTLVDSSLSAGTIFTGGDGTDRVDYGARAEGVSVSLGIAADDGAPGEGDNILAENVTGGRGNDTIIGSGAENGLTGGEGADTLVGGGGSDVLNGDAGNDTLSGGPGDDLIDGDAGTDSIAGGGGADQISAADRVAETIDCGAGLDTAVIDRGAGGVIDRTIGCEDVSGPTAPDAGAASGPRPSVGVAGLTTVRAPGTPNAADLTPPSASLRAAIRQKIKTVRTRGVAIRIACDEACGISAALAVARPTARRLGLAQTGGAVLGTAKATRATEGVVQMRVKLSPKARQRLRRTKKVTITAQALVSDATGNGTLLQRRVTLVP